MESDLGWKDKIEHEIMIPLTALLKAQSADP